MVRILARARHEAAVRRALDRGRVVALVGPRQCGKTTLARHFVPVASENYFDLEDPADLARLAEPMTSLARLRGTVVIDEVQRRPDLFPVLRVLADRLPRPARFLVLGSASPELLRQSSESLAGRLTVLEMAGFTVHDLGQTHMDRLWRRGGLPRAYLARSDRESLDWRNGFVRTFLERDLAQLGQAVAAPTMHRFWSMVAHYHGQIWNSAEPARSLGVSEMTIRRYLDLLTGVFMVRQLPPWHENLAKRQVKAAKVYVRDSGLLHALLGLDSPAALARHPKAGASWEGWVIEEILAGLAPTGAYFWATHQGAELDLLLLRGTRRFGVEIKRADAPSLTSSIRIAMSDLALERLVVIYPGNRRYRLAEGIDAVPAAALASLSWRGLFRS